MLKRRFAPSVVVVVLVLLAVVVVAGRARPATLIVPLYGLAAAAAAAAVSTLAGVTRGARESIFRKAGWRRRVVVQRERPAAAVKEICTAAGAKEVKTMARTGRPYIMALRSLVVATDMPASPPSWCKVSKVVRRIEVSERKGGKSTESGRLTRNVMCCRKPVASGRMKYGSGYTKSGNHQKPPTSMPGTGTSAMFLKSLQNAKPTGICNIGRKLFHKLMSAF